MASDKAIAGAVMAAATEMEMRFFFITLLWSKLSSLSGTDFLDVLDRDPVIALIVPAGSLGVLMGGHALSGFEGRLGMLEIGGDAGGLEGPVANSRRFDAC